jgi:amino acid transporter
MAVCGAAIKRERALGAKLSRWRALAGLASAAPFPFFALYHFEAPSRLADRTKRQPLALAGSTIACGAAAPIPFSVMAGLVPAIHVFDGGRKLRGGDRVSWSSFFALKRVDGRVFARP